MSLKHVPSQLSPFEAFQNIEKFDWKNFSDLTFADMKCRKIWIPFNSLTLTPVFSDSNPFIENTNELPLYTKLPKPINTPPPENTDEIIIPFEASASILLIPFYFFENIHDKRDRMLIDGIEGIPCSGQIPANPAISKIKWIYTCLLLVTAVFFGTNLFLQFLAPVIGFFSSSLLAVLFPVVPSNFLVAGAFLSVLTGCCFIRWFFLKLKTLLPLTVLESAARAQTSRIKYPVDLFEYKLMQSLGLILLAFLPYYIFTSFSVSESWTVIIIWIFIIYVFYLVIYLIYNSKILFLKTKLQNKPTDTSFVSGSEIGDISRLTIHILLYSVLGSLVSKIIIAAKLPMVTGVPYLNDPYFLYSSGIGIGALLGIYSLEIAQKNFQKSVLFLILFQIFGKQFLGPFAELLVYFFGLGSVFDYFFKKECNIPDNKANFINGITIAWYSQFYELSGKYTGRFLGLLIIGPEGSVVGELLGEKIAGILGISLGWRKLRINASEEASISNKSDVQN